MLKDTQHEGQIRGHPKFHAGVDSNPLRNKQSLEIFEEGHEWHDEQGVRNLILFSSPPPPPPGDQSLRSADNSLWCQSNISCRLREESQSQRGKGCVPSRPPSMEIKGCPSSASTLASIAIVWNALRFIHISKCFVLWFWCCATRKHPCFMMCCVWLDRLQDH